MCNDLIKILIVPQLWKSQHCFIFLSFEHWEYPYWRAFLMILLMLRLRMHSTVRSKEDQKNNLAPSRAAAMTVRALINGSDSWVLKRKEKTHVQATEMTSLRGIVPSYRAWSYTTGKLRTLVYIFSVLDKLEVITIIGQAILNGWRKTGTRKFPSIFTI